MTLICIASAPCCCCCWICCLVARLGVPPSLRCSSLLDSMSFEFDQVKVLEKCSISPPPNSVPTTAIPLTFLDVPWLSCFPIQRVFLYQVTFSVARFTEEVLPQLKKSLSLALQLYFPFCGNTVFAPQPSEPYIMYKDGDSVPLLVLQCDGSFSEFLRDEPRDAKEIHLLVPPTPPTRVLDDTLEKLTPVLAVQVTLFPNSGLCIGIAFSHVVADGTSFNNFVKTWSYIFNANCDMSGMSINLPVHDRSVIKDSNGIKDVVLSKWRTCGCPTGNETTVSLLEDSVRATFTLSRVEIDQLKKWVSTKCVKGAETVPSSQFSSFVVTYAFVWVCLINSLNTITPAADDSSKTVEMCHLGIAADARNRYDLGIPASFFGNCLGLRIISLPRSTFQQEDCIAVAAEAIRYDVQSLKNGIFDEYELGFPKLTEAVSKGESLLTVAGSPRLAAYDTDFGWGRPAKTEVVHIDVSGSISLNESRNEKGGIEIGICRSRHHMEVFTSFFQAGMNQFLQ